jgi:hypothetical protein
MFSAFIFPHKWHSGLRLEYVQSQHYALIWNWNLLRIVWAEALAPGQLLREGDPLPGVPDVAVTHVAHQFDVHEVSHCTALARPCAAFVAL